jgi:3'-5' exoribonuclease
MVTDLAEGDRFDQPFLVRSRELRTTRTGKPYLQIELADRTGVLTGRMWDADAGLLDDVAADGFVLVRGRAETYRGQMQIIVEGIDPLPESQVTIDDFVPATTRDVDVMFDRLIEIAKTVKEIGLRKLLAAFLKDDEIVARFRRCPGAVSYHHPFLGGLLEHTLGVCELGLVVADHHPELDREMFITGCVLHDLGKIHEFNYERSFSYTDSGELLGHLYIGARMVEERAKEIDELSAHRAEELAHLILSHHGEYQYQSPKLPMTAEALAVHHLDNLDAKLQAFRQAMAKDTDPASRWTEYNRMFERRLFKGHEAAEAGEG